MTVTATGQDVLAAERTLPHNLSAEQSILGAILVHGDTWKDAAVVISPDDFFRDAHRRIFAAMSRLVEQSVGIDFVTLQEELTRVGDIDEVGGPAYVASLAAGVPRSTNVKYYCGIVKEKKILRDIICESNRTLTLAYEAEDFADALLDHAVTRLLALARPSSQGSVTIGQATQEYVQAFDNQQGTGIATGLTDLDELLRGGLHPRQVVMIAGRPGMGKSTLAMNVAEHIASKEIPVGVFSLEMDYLSIAEQAVSRNAQVDLHRIHARALSQKDWARVAYAVESLNKMAIHIVQEAETLAQVEAWSRRLVEDFGVGVLVLDYIQRMGDAATRDRRLEIDILSRGFTRIAKALNVPFVVLSQLTRASDQRLDKRPQLSDLKESSALEADAHVVVLIYRADVYNKDPNNPDSGIAELIVAKNRSGSTGTCKVAFLREQGRFANLAYGA